MNSINDFYIKTNNGPLEETYYDWQIKDLAVGASIRICRHTEAALEASHPRHLLANETKLLT